MVDQVCRQGRNPERPILQDFVKTFGLGLWVILNGLGWFFRLYPRAVGGEGLSAWTDLTRRLYKLKGSR
jgi:hypothetical protein